MTTRYASTFSPFYIVTLINIKMKVISSVLLLLLFLNLIEFTQLKLHHFSLGESRMRESLQRCIVNASRLFFDENEEIYYSLPLTKADLKDEAGITFSLTSVLVPELEKNWPVLVRKADNKYFKEFSFDIGSEPFENYIIQIRYEDEFHKHLDKLVQDANWNPHAKFMVISLSIFENPLELATTIMKKFWNVQVIDCVVVFPNASNHNSFDIFTWYPYSDNNCGDDFTNTTLIDSCSFGIRKRLDVNWFGKKIPRRLNRCKIEVRVVDLVPFVINTANDSLDDHNDYFDTKGLDVNLMNVVAERLNVQMHYISTAIPLNFGDIFRNKTANGELYYIHNNLADVVVGGYAKTIERHQNLDDSVSYYQENIHWCVPHSPINTNMDSLLNTISIGAWILISCFFLIVTILLWLSSQCEHESSSYRLLGSCFLNSYAILLSTTVAVQPKRTKARFVLTFLLLASFYLINAYQTLMMSALSDKNYAEEIVTEEDIEQSNLQIYTMSFFQRTLQMNGNHGISKTLSKIIKKWKVCNEIDECIEYVGVRRDSIFTVPQSLMKFTIASYLSLDNEPLIACHNNVLFTYPINILMRKGFPLFRLINELVQGMVASGLVLRWEHEIDERHLKKVTRYDIEINGNGNNSLDFFSLQPIFVMLLIGEAFAVVAFVGEFAYYFRSKSPPHKGNFIH